jgi:hypothetical protein
MVPMKTVVSSLLRNFVGGFDDLGLVKGGAPSWQCAVKTVLECILLFKVPLFDQAVWHWSSSANFLTLFPEK